LFLATCFRLGHVRSSEGRVTIHKIPFGRRKKNDSPGASTGWWALAGCARIIVLAQGNQGLAPCTLKPGPLKSDRPAGRHRASMPSTVFFSNGNYKWPRAFTSGPGRRRNREMMKTVCGKAEVFFSVRAQGSPLGGAGWCRVPRTVLHPGMQWRKAIRPQAEEYFGKTLIFQGQSPANRVGLCDFRFDWRPRALPGRWVFPFPSKPSAVRWRGVSAPTFHPPGPEGPTPFGPISRAILLGLCREFQETFKLLPDEAAFGSTPGQDKSVLFGRIAEATSLHFDDYPSRHRPASDTPHRAPI